MNKENFCLTEKRLCQTELAVSAARVGNRVSFRVGKKYHAFIVTQAMKKRLTPSGYVRKMVKAEVERVWNEEHSSGATHLEALAT